MLEVITATVLICNCFWLWRISYYLKGVEYRLNGVINQLYEIDLSLNQ